MLIRAPRTIIEFVLDAIDPYSLKRALERINELRDLASASADLEFLWHLRRATLPMPLIDRPEPVCGEVFGPLRVRRVDALEGRRVAVITSGGSGGCIALIGAARAFEEAGIRPAMISCWSGSVIWGAMWAAGLSAREMADVSLSWRPEDYLDIQWSRLPRFLLSALRDFTGLATGEAIERLFDQQTWSRPAGELEIPLSTIVYNMDLGEVDYFGTTSTPEITVGQLVRIGIALPLFIESVEVRGHLYVDGGIIDLFPAEPVIADASIDHAFAINVMLPKGFQAEDVTGWQTHRMGVLRASKQLQQGYHLELARRSQRQLGDRLTVVDPIDYKLLRGVSFYDLFIDRRRWPELIRQGYLATRRALDSFAHDHRAAHRRSPERPPSRRSARQSSDDSKERRMEQRVTISDVIERYGYFAHRGDPDAASEGWEETGMESGEVEGWLEARCFDPEAAEDIDEVGITPDMASVRTDAGSGGYVDTVGYKVAASDLGLEEACALLGIDASTVPDPFASDTPTGSSARP